MKPYRVLDLFSGIGGFSLGLERTGGFETVAFCEIDPFCRKVLAKHWPNVRQYDDVRELTAERLAADGIAVDAICGGFPCQDISAAGKGAGIEGERSGLWSEYHRLIRELRPNVVLVENVAALLYRGMGVVLGDLAEIGYDAEWECVPASAVGAPHIRDRVWILAYPGRQPRSIRGFFEGESWHGCQFTFTQTDGWREAERGKNWELAPLVPRVHPGVAAAWWRHQSSVGRTANGLPGQLDRTGSLGNAVVPQIPEIIGRAILQAHEAREAA